MERRAVSLDPIVVRAIAANLFPASHAAIDDWDTFPWHLDRHKRPQTDKRHSSQALAIDVFGTIKTSPHRDAVMGRIAQACGLPTEGPWSIEPEWIDDRNLLNERRQTQVDALAWSPSAVLVIECKFTEGGGACSQPKSAAGRPAQCTGQYEVQTNSRNGVTGRCALSGKKIRYWEVIPEVYGLDARATHSPCPFKGEQFQWMRNIVLAAELGRADNKAARMLLAYAAGPDFATARKVASGKLMVPPPTPQYAPPALSFQQIVDLARDAAPSESENWTALEAWISTKVGDAERLLAPS